jgi:type VI protein secretion system component Hcp
VGRRAVHVLTGDETMRSKTTLQALALAVAIAAATLIPSPAAAEFDGFLKIPGLPGESTVKGHEGEITLVSYTQIAGTGACFRVIAIKQLDLASPGLALLAVTNQVVTPVKITLAKAGQAPFDAFVAVLENVTVGNVELVEVDGTPVPTERVTLRPRRATLTYRQQALDGGLGEEVTKVINCP